LTTIDPDAIEVDPMPPAQYRNLAGAIVTIRDTGTPAAANLSGHHYLAECGGCQDTSSPAYSPSDLAAARKWASSHASTCRAVPRFISGAEVDRAKWIPLAEGCAHRAVRLLEGKSAIAGLGAGPLEAANPIESAQIYANLADVYARFAGL
jgi:hypothetical protein